jgi:hypothetical protein
LVAISRGAHKECGGRVPVLSIVTRVQAPRPRELTMNPALCHVGADRSPTHHIALKIII